MADKTPQPLVLPALRARMGIWIYYVSLMRMQDIARRISIAQDIHVSDSLKDLLQRELTDRSEEIAAYLIRQKQRFFNSLVVGTYGGNPKWTELSIRQKDTDIDVPEHTEGVLGFLILNGTEKLFAIDGQHRVAGIQQAVKASKDLRDEELSVIFVAGVTSQYRDEDPAGFERTRRLFTTLNRYAKPVSKKDIIALDEDDVVAIITRYLVERHPLFVDKIAVKQPINIAVGNKQSVTTIVALYDAMDIYLQDKSDWSDYKKKRPPDKVLDYYYKEATRFWGVMIRNFPSLSEVRDSQPNENVPGKYRHRQGGHILFRPIGLLMCVRVVRHLLDSGVSLRDAIKRIAKVPMNLADEPWVDLLWDKTNRRMITSPENQNAAKQLLFYSVGGSLAHLKSDPTRLAHELAGLLKRQPDTIKLPKYI